MCWLCTVRSDQLTALRRRESDGREPENLLAEEPPTDGGREGADRRPAAQSEAAAGTEPAAGSEIEPRR